MNEFWRRAGGYRISLVPAAHGWVVVESPRPCGDGDVRSIRPEVRHPDLDRQDAERLFWLLVKGWRQYAVRMNFALHDEEHRQIMTDPD